MPGTSGLRPWARTHHKKALCHTCPVDGTEDKYRCKAVVVLLNCTNPVDGAHFVQMRYQHDGSSRMCHVCVTSVDMDDGETKHLRHAAMTDIPRASRGRPQALTLLGGARFITWCLRRPFLDEYRRGQRHFWAGLSYVPALGPTLNKGLVLNSIVWWGVQQLPLVASATQLKLYYFSIIHPRCIKEVFSDATVFIADFGLFLHHIGSNSNPGMTLEEPSRHHDRDVLRSCLYQSVVGNEYGDTSSNPGRDWFHFT